MNPGVPFKNRIVTRGESLSWGGDGRYVYIVTSAGTIDVFDGNLLNVANVSAGAWIVNPRIATITPATLTGIQAIGYSVKRDAIIVGSNTTAWVGSIHPTTYAEIQLKFIGSGTYSSLVVMQEADAALINDNGSGTFIFLGNNNQYVGPTSQILCRKIVGGYPLIRMVGYHNPIRLSTIFMGSILDSVRVNNRHYLSSFLGSTIRVVSISKTGVITTLAVISGFSLIYSNIAYNFTNQKLYVSHYTNPAAVIHIVNLATNTRTSIAVTSAVRPDNMWHEYSNTFITTRASSITVDIVDCSTDTLLPTLTLSANSLSNAFQSTICSNRLRYDG